MCDVIIQCLVQQIIKLLCGTIFCKLICIKHQAKIHSFLALIYLAIIIILLTCLNKNEWYEYIDILILLILLLYSLSNVYNIWDLEYNYYRYAVAYQILDFKKLKEIAPNNVYVDLPTQKENFNMSNLLDDLKNNTGLVEFIDVDEADTSLVCTTLDKFKREEYNDFTHMEIHPSIIMGFIGFK